MAVIFNCKKILPKNRQHEPLYDTGDMILFPMGLAVDQFPSRHKAESKLSGYGLIKEPGPFCDANELFSTNVGLVYIRCLHYFLMKNEGRRHR